MNNTFKYAKKYLGLGWNVLPLLAKSKIPATPHGFKDASDDSNKVKEWFDTDWNNIGIATGKVSGIAIIDIDPKNGGSESYKVLKSKFGLPTRTLKVRTGGGRLHLYYSTDGEVRSRNGILPGIDIKSNGGYVVAPPSVHPNGKRYEFVDPSIFEQQTLLPFPSQVIEAIDNEKRPPKNKTEKSRTSKVEAEPQSPGKIPILFALQLMAYGMVVILTPKVGSSYQSPSE